MGRFVPAAVGATHRFALLLLFRGAFYTANRQTINSDLELLTWFIGALA
jgi:hypothetical protein